MVDILCIGAHPDDCEMFMGGTILMLKESGYKLGICDLSHGEAGTYGDASTRRIEQDCANEILGLEVRITLDLPDGQILNTSENRLKLVEVIRKLRPELVFSFRDDSPRHPDHRSCGRLARECCFISGLSKISTASPAHRPSQFIAFAELFDYHQPDFVLDVTAYWDKKEEVIRCYRTQVTQEGEDDSSSKTFIRSNRFWEILRARALISGSMIDTKYGEGFFSDRPPKLTDPLAAFRKELK